MSGETEVGWGVIIWHRDSDHTKPGCTQDMKESGDGPGVSLSGPHGCPATAVFPLDSRPRPTLERNWPASPRFSSVLQYPFCDSHDLRATQHTARGRLRKPWRWSKQNETEACDKLTGQQWDPQAKQIPSTSECHPNQSPMSLSTPRCFVSVAYWLDCILQLTVSRAQSTSCDTF